MHDIQQTVFDSVYGLRQSRLFLCFWTLSIERDRENILVDSENIFLHSNYERKAFLGLASVKSGNTAGHPEWSRWLHLDHMGSQSEHRICFDHLARK